VQRRCNEKAPIKSTVIGVKGHTDQTLAVALDSAFNSSLRGAFFAQCELYLPGFPLRKATIGGAEENLKAIAAGF
jgi:hypothetical protein